MERNRPSPHIGYEKGASPHDEVVAQLVCAYTPSGGQVLDVGCGVGHMLHAVQRSNSSLRLYAADIDSRCITITSDRVELSGTYLISESLEDLFCVDLAFDMIVLSHVLEHVHRPLDAVHGVMNLLKPGGIFILAVPNPVRGSVILGNVFRRHYVNKGHVYAWDRSHWMNFLERIAGVRVVDYPVDYCDVPILSRSRLLSKPLRYLAKVFPWFSYSNIAIVQKPHEF